MDEISLESYGGQLLAKEYAAHLKERIGGEFSDASFCWENLSSLCNRNPLLGMLSFVLLSMLDRTVFLFSFLFRCKLCPLGLRRFQCMVAHVIGENHAKQNVFDPQHFT